MEKQLEEKDEKDEKSLAEIAFQIIGYGVVGAIIGFIFWCLGVSNFLEMYDTDLLQTVFASAVLWPFLGTFLGAISGFILLHRK